MVTFVGIVSVTTAPGTENPPFALTSTVTAGIVSATGRSLRLIEDAAGVV